MIVYRHEPAAFSVPELMDLFARSATWRMPREPADWRDLLANTSLLVSAWDGPNLVGFARLLTDFVRWASFGEVVVAPEHQGRGIGTELVRRLLDHPRVAHVRTFWLGTEDAFEFYERLGFRRDGTGHGMMLVRRERDAALTSFDAAPLETARTDMRPFRLSDAEAAFAWCSDPAVMRLRRTDATLDDTRVRLEAQVVHQVRHGFSKWLVTAKDGGRPLGQAGIAVLEETGEVELGFRFLRSEWGKGLATETATAWLAEAERLGLGRVIAFAHPGNRASLRVIEKLGMLFHRRDVLMGHEALVFETSTDNRSPAAVE